MLVRQRERSPGIDEVRLQAYRMEGRQQRDAREAADRLRKREYRNEADDEALAGGECAQHAFHHDRAHREDCAEGDCRLREVKILRPCQHAGTRIGKCGDADHEDREEHGPR